MSSMQSKSSLADHFSEHTSLDESTKCVKKDPMAQSQKVPGPTQRVAIEKDMAAVIAKQNDDFFNQITSSQKIHRDRFNGQSSSRVSISRKEAQILKGGVNLGLTSKFKNLRQDSKRNLKNKKRGHSMTIEEATTRGINIMKGTKFTKKIEGHTVFNQNEEMGLWRSPWKLLCDGILPEKNEPQKFENKILHDIVTKYQQFQFKKHQRERSKNEVKRKMTQTGSGGQSPNSRKTISIPQENFLNTSIMPMSQRKASIIQPQKIQHLNSRGHERVMGYKTITPKQSEPTVTDGYDPNQSQGSIGEYKSQNSLEINSRATRRVKIGDVDNMDTETTRRQKTVQSGAMDTQRQFQQVCCAQEHIPDYVKQSTKWQRLNKLNQDLANVNSKCQKFDDFLYKLSKKLKIKDKKMVEQEMYERSKTQSPFKSQRSSDNSTKLRNHSMESIQSKPVSHRNKSLTPSIHEDERSTKINRKDSSVAESLRQGLNEPSQIVPSSKGPITIFNQINYSVEENQGEIPSPKFKQRVDDRAGTQLSQFNAQKIMNNQKQGERLGTAPAPDFQGGASLIQGSLLSSKDRTYKHQYRNKWDVRYDQVSNRLFEIDQRLGQLDSQKRENERSCMTSAGKENQNGTSVLQQRKKLYKNNKYGLQTFDMKRQNLTSHNTVRHATYQDLSKENSIETEVIVPVNETNNTGSFQHNSTFRSNEMMSNNLEPIMSRRAESQAHSSKKIQMQFNKFISHRTPALAEQFKYTDFAKLIVSKNKTDKKLLKEIMCKPVPKVSHRRNQTSHIGYGNPQHFLSLDNSIKAKATSGAIMRLARQRYSHRPTTQQDTRDIRNITFAPNTINMVAMTPNDHDRRLFSNQNQRPKLVKLKNQQVLVHDYQDQKAAVEPPSVQSKKNSIQEALQPTEADVIPSDLGINQATMNLGLHVRRNTEDIIEQKTPTQIMPTVIRAFDSHSNSGTGSPLKKEDTVNDYEDMATRNIQFGKTDSQFTGNITERVITDKKQTPSFTNIKDGSGSQQTQKTNSMKVDKIIVAKSNQFICEIELDE